ncbi:hypothetical protein [Jeotgalibacillus haloalkalitolerans]|uniref:LysM domain-containing protein n=1 Tax=Jeotgalibacillus haloalkalitolerans TaxID=3104292 RepID=A0ABU5KMI2_9BACL|nr:hypothetical protein [Jeotgalibacillus sp. HH7-29]MDZ5712375.1 hypothetical protein [Jeotgalibacillus sp. HH7-29]
MTKNTIYQLQENIVFKGEYVLSELRSLSFEPSVSITEHADQVVVEGTLHLAGEGSYEPGTEKHRNSKNPEVQESIVMEDLIYFEHHFPLSISISSARVVRKQDVEVYIDHVDYEIPEDGILNVSADIMIEGISEPKPEPELQREELRVLPNPLEQWEGMAATEETNEAAESESAAHDLQNEPAEEHAAEKQFEPQEDVAEHEPVEEVQQDETETDRAEEQTAEEKEDEVSEQTEQKNREDTFTRFIKSLEEERTSIKIHIAQQDETPETVAERYGVPMLQLMKANQFESRRPFNRGELIRIPGAQIHSK